MKHNDIITESKHAAIIIFYDLPTTMPSPSVQGHAYFFRQIDSNSSLLSCEILRKRFISPEHIEGECFIDNTNLNSSRKFKNLGCLVALCRTPFRRTLNAAKVSRETWTLCTIITLHPSKTILCPCYFQDNAAQFNHENLIQLNDTKFQLRYLNRIHNNSIASSDGFIEADINGPDCLESHDINFKKWSKDKKHVLGRTYFNHLDDKKIFEVKRLSLQTLPTTQRYHRRCGNLEHGYRNKRKLSTVKKDATTVKVNPFPISKLLLSVEGFAFPYIPGRTVTNYITFAIVAEEDAKRIIEKETISRCEYKELLNKYAVYKIQVLDVDVTDDSLTVEKDKNISVGRYSQVMDDTTKTPAERTGVIHGYWQFQDILEVDCWDTIHLLLRHVYGDHGFQRSSSKCFGLNTYTGKKDAGYVRPTPRMSKESTTYSEYFRQDFDPTFMPLVHDLVTKLSHCATTFQRFTDSIFDSFEKECRKIWADIILQVNDIKDTPEKTFVDDSEFKKRRFAFLSILTAGNSKVRGFTNTVHTDKYDAWNKILLCIAESLLQELSDQAQLQKDPILGMAVKHIQRLSTASVKNAFSSYTTCGYHLNFKSRHTKRRCLAFFLYLSLKVAVSIPLNRVCFHTFGGFMGEHLTTVPLTYDDDNVYFNDKDLFVFAWGNGRSTKRTYLDKRNFPIQGNAVTNNDILRYFNERATNVERNDTRNRFDDVNFG